MGREYPEYPIPAVGAVVLRRESDGESSVLLVRRANPPSAGEWSIPGGVLELGETLEAAVVREVLEETGLVVTPVGVLEVLDHIIRDEVSSEGEGGRVHFHYVLIDFVCKVDAGCISEVTSASDALDAQWVRRSEISKKNKFALRSQTIKVIQKAFAACEKQSRMKRDTIQSFGL